MGNNYLGSQHYNINGGHFREFNFKVQWTH